MRKWIGNRINEKIIQKYINIHSASGRYIMGVRTALHRCTSASGCESEQETMLAWKVPVMREADASFHARPNGLWCPSGWSLFYEGPNALLLGVSRNLSSLSLSHTFFYGFFIQNLWSTKIQPSKLKSVFENVILALGSTFLPIGLRYFHKLLSLEILG